MNKIKSVISEPLFFIVFVVLFSFSCFSVLPNWFIKGALTASLCLKSCLLFFIPFLIFSGTAVAFSGLRKNGALFVLTIMGIVIFSNFINLMLSGLVGFYVVPFVSKGASGFETFAPCESILPYFTIQLPAFFSNTMALISGILTGLLYSFSPSKKIFITIQVLHKYTMLFMLRGFIPLLPIFLLGFLLKLLKEGQLISFVNNNFYAFLAMIGFLVLYLCIWFLAASKVSKIKVITLLKNIFPAMITAASTMSSAASLPFSIKATTANTKDPLLANAVMPITLNFHMVGDTICIPVMALMIMHSFHMPPPTISAFVIFGICFVLNKFAGAGIPGGTIMVSLPILQQYLGFSEEMLALIAAFYMLVDPITTTGNVTANNLLAVFIKKIPIVKL